MKLFHKLSTAHRPGISEAIGESALLVVLVGFGVAARLAFQELPNFAPVAALALFAGYVLRRSWVAALVPLSVMTISDWFIGGYDWTLMALVYAMLTLPVAFRGLLRHYFRFSPGRLTAALKPVCGLLICSFACSVTFFIVTNFGCWALYEWYPRSLSGLASCYVQAWPFFRHTVTGDMFFASLLFGSYAVAASRGSVRVPATAH
jgi:uncharacterized membrane protein